VLNKAPRNEDVLGEYRYSSTYYLPKNYIEINGQPHAPAALPPVRTRYPEDTKLGGLQTMSGRGGEEKNSHHCPCWETEPRVVQAVA